MVVGNHFATLPTYVVPSFCACLQPVVSLGPHEGATTHHYQEVFLYFLKFVGCVSVMSVASLYGGATFVLGS